MGFKQCSSCKGYYNANRGGCINPGCVACDKAQTAKVTSAPKVPKRPPPPRPKTKPNPDNKPSWATRQLKTPVKIGAPPKTGGPAPVVVAASPIVSTSVYEQNDTGYHVIYRGDTRTPAQLAGYGGFTAWVPLNDEQARDVVKRAQGQNFTIKLPMGAKRLEDAFNKNENLNLLTLGRQIKLEKAGDTFHISTDPTPACGGYASGYIYAMKFKTLYLVDKSGKVETGSLKDVSGINPKLVLNTPSLSTASVIALAIPGQSGVEVAFLTSIPMSNIYKYRMPKSATWYEIS